MYKQASKSLWKLQIITQFHFPHAFWTPSPHHKGTYVYTDAYTDTLSVGACSENVQDAQFKMVMDHWIRHSKKLNIWSHRITSLQLIWIISNPQNKFLQLCSYPGVCIQVHPTPAFNLECRLFFGLTRILPKLRGLLFKDPQPLSFSEDSHLLRAIVLAILNMPLVLSDIILQGISFLYYLFWSIYTLFSGLSKANLTLEVLYPPLHLRLCK